MRSSRRIVKPTKIFDNSDNNTSKNKNKQKNVSKKKNSFRNASDMLVDFDGERDIVNGNENVGNEDEIIEGMNEDVYDGNPGRKDNDNKEEQSYVSGKDGDNGKKNFMLSWFIRGEMVNNSGFCSLTFRNEEGMNKVLDLGPWLVNNKPLFVQKWDPSMGLNKVEQTKVPLWVSIVNVPLEAWSTEGISALASSLGKPLIMDNMTAKRCQFGEGRLDYARVLVEFDVKKGCKDKIEIHVFRHCFEKCTKRERSVKEIEKDKKLEEEKKRQNAGENRNRQYGGYEMGYRRQADKRIIKDKGTFFNGNKRNEAKGTKGDVWRKKDVREEVKRSVKNNQKDKGETSQSKDGIG
ncbi:zinc knuckle CX2CX4HX4C containing protein, partial [Tanacetum coccineum]